MNSKEIKWNIRQARKSLHLTQSELAFRMGISRQSYISLESGTTAIINPNIAKMSDATGLPEEEILFAPSRKEMSYSELKERDRLPEQTASLRKSYEKEINSLKSRLELLEEMHGQDRLLIDTLSAWNRSLKSQLGIPEAASEESDKD